MTGYLFVPQTLLDQWLEAGKVDITADGLRLVEEDRTVGIEPAFHFTSMLEGEDTQALIGQVKTEDAVKELGGEAFGDSALFGDIGYQVVPGFATVLTGPIQGAQPTAAAAAPRVTNPGMPAATPKTLPPGEKPQEVDLLSQFLLGQK